MPQFAVQLKFYTKKKSKIIKMTRKSTILAFFSVIDCKNLKVREKPNQKAIHGSYSANF